MRLYTLAMTVYMHKLRFVDVSIGFQKKQYWMPSGILPQSGDKKAHLVLPF